MPEERLAPAGHLTHPSSASSPGLLLWALGRLASVRAAHVPGILNVAADMLLKEGPPPWDWSLHPQVVQHLCDKIGRAQVDLFASLDNAHCHLWYSVSEPPGALGLDALAHDWPGLELTHSPLFP